VRRLLPDPVEEIDALEVYAAPPRVRRADRPWVVLNMVASVDGATALEGVSGGLGGPPDRTVFRAVRAIPDVILVAAGTVRAEGYGPPRADDEVRALRVARGQAAVPRLAIVTATVDLDPSLGVFSDASAPPLVLVPPDAPERHATRVAALRDCAEVVVAGDRPGTIDLDAALALVPGPGGIVLAEGGPSLNGQLAAGALIDELVMTVAPLVVSGDAARISHGTELAQPLTLELSWVLEEDGVIFLRYLAADVTGRSPG
jgi:riboflavin biosynthesis pyrimidine reductase